MIPTSSLKLHFYNYNQLTRFKIQNAHHTIKLNPIEPQLDGSPLKPLEAGEEISDPQAAGAANSSAAPTPSPAPPATDSQPADELEPEFETSAASRPHRLDEAAAAGASQLGRSGQPAAADESSPGANELPPYRGLPSIKLDWLDDGNNEYKLRDIHFHWAERRDNGSEHAIDGRRSAMEVSWLLAN